MNLNKHIWEGWTVGMFIKDLEWLFDRIQSGNSHVKPFESAAVLKEWCKDNQSYYKKHIPEVFNYFKNKIGSLKK